MTNKILKHFYFLLLISLLFSGCNRNEDTPEGDGNDKPTISAADLTVDENGLSFSYVTLKTVHGNISIHLYPRKAPNTTTRFIQLVNEGFYDNLSFHRVIKRYLVQTGDPHGTGSGGSGKKLPAEFNSIQHIKGTVAMARNAHDTNSADSQFYITLTTLPHLDGEYTVFGQVIKGLDVLEKIQKDDKVLSMSFTSVEDEK